MTSSAVGGSWAASAMTPAVPLLPDADTVRGTPGITFARYGISVAAHVMAGADVVGISFFSSTSAMVVLPASPASRLRTHCVEPLTSAYAPHQSNRVSCTDSPVALATASMSWKRDSMVALTVG